MNESKCKACGRKIYWAKSPKGKMNPYVRVKVFDIVTDEDGSEAFEILPQAQVYISHFIDCPAASKF